MMLDDGTTETLAEALAAVERSHDATASGALAAFAELGAAGHRLRIDWRASDRLGAPVILAVPAPPALAALSPRQREVADALAAGHSNKEIARSLGISVATVKDHVHAVLSRLGLERRGQVTALVGSVRPDLGADHPSKDGGPLHCG
ncbi:MAG: helix-turn-helix transcriptional regulator [Actinomycetota bacterium]